MRWAKIIWTIAVTLILLDAARLSQAQSDARAAITAPLPGATLDGSTTILGAATHPTFVRYELAFAYDADPTGTWFSIQAPVLTAVDEGGLLGQWETTGMTEGVYALRLRVYGSERVFIETVVRDLRVARLVLTAAPAPSPTSLPLPTVTILPGPTVTALVFSTPVPPTTRDALEFSIANAVSFASTSLATVPYETAFWEGATFSLTLFSILGVYWVIRSVLRQFWRNRHDGES
jgi:hypothetical protein